MTRLTASSKDILRNRVSILALLHSLGGDSSNKENQVATSIVLQHVTSHSACIVRSDFIKTYQFLFELIRNNMDLPEDMCE